MLFLTENNPQILHRSKQKKGTPSEKGVSFKWSKQKSVCGISVVKREIAAVFTAAISILVDPIGIEPTTLRMRTVRSPMRKTSMRPKVGQKNSKSRNK